MTGKDGVQSMNRLRVSNLRCEYKENPIGIDVRVPRFSWQLQGNSRNTMQTAYQIRVSKDPLFQKLDWDSGMVVSDQSIHVIYEGPALQSSTRYYYTVRVWDNKGNQSDWSSNAFFESGLLTTAEWSAKWITAKHEDGDTDYKPCPMFRRAFEVKDSIQSARIYATALGIYALELNGKPVSDWLFTPGWTSYHKRLQYQTYDVTQLLKSGSNALGAMVGDGWYSGDMTPDIKRNYYGDQTALLLQMHIKYEDGTEDVLVSDEQWKTSTGPVLMSEIYHGETYDARLEKKGWTSSAFDDWDWAKVNILDHTKEILTAQENEPVRRIDYLKPIELITTPAGETVLDMGQNMVGWVRFHVTGERGTRVTLQHAEILDPDGNFYTANIRKARQFIEYICSGDGNEMYEPHFTFQGFRYVKVEGYPGLLNPDDFTGVAIHSDMEVSGSFECSDPLVNQLQKNIVWGQKGNFLDIPTDCPQRDERLGWTGDAQVFIRTACFNRNVASFFTKWLRDLEADQAENGEVPYVVPNLFGEGASAAWGDAAVICPWTLYQCYGDKRILEQQYESMKGWVEYIRAQGENEYLWNTGTHFGDWLALDAPGDHLVGATAKDYIATAFYAYSTDLLCKTAEILGRKDDVEEYSLLHKNILEHFVTEFVTASGRLAVPTQTAHVLVLMFDLLPPQYIQRTVDTLVETIHQNKDHLSTGFVGTPYLCLVLSRYGHHDLAYKLVQQKDYPSWLYPITKGATTIWEHWNGIKEDGSLWFDWMNSFNHYAYGSIGDWLYRIAAGIDTDPVKTGYKQIHIDPKPGYGFDYVKAELETMYGLIRSSWQDKGDEMEISIEIPANTTARVVLPFAEADAVFEENTCLKDQKDILNICQLDGAVQLEVGSGDYCFKYTKKVQCSQRNRQVQ